MFIRCAQCHGALWLDLREERGGDASGTCERCGQAYRVQGPDSHEATDELHKTARYFAVENGIDLPSAYSVCLHLMGLEQAQDAVGVSADMPAPDAPAEDRPATAAPTAKPSAALPAPAPARARETRPGRLYDPAFHAAVESGSLTTRQAFERGNRDAFAQRLIERHGLADEAAYAVADNRISLLAAIRRKPDATAAQKDDAAITVRIGPRGTGSSRRRWVAAAVAVVLVAGAAAAALRLRRSEPPVDPSEITVVTDTKGRVVQVAGPDPGSVLAAYCDSRKTQVPLEPLGLMPAVLETSRLRIGILRDPSADSDAALLAIPIRNGTDGVRWVAGDGRAPLVAMRAPQGADATFSRKEPNEVIER